MAAKEISVKKYVVRLSGDEREQLEILIERKEPGQRLLKAWILLKADVSEAGDGGATAGRWRHWRPAHPWSTGCASNWWKRASMRC